MKPLPHAEMEEEDRQPTSQMSVNISWNSPVVKTFLSIHEVQNFTEIAFGKKKKVERVNGDAVSLSSSVSSSGCSDDESVSSSPSMPSEDSDEDIIEGASSRKQKAQALKRRKGQKSRVGTNKKKRKQIQKTSNRKKKVKLTKVQKDSRLKDTIEKEVSLPKLSSLALKSFVLLKPLDVDKGTPRRFRLAQICKHLKDKKVSEVHFWETYAKLGNKVSRNHRYFPAWSNPENGVEIYQNFRSKFAVPMTWNVSDNDLIHAFEEMGPRNTFPTDIIRMLNKLISKTK